MKEIGLIEFLVELVFLTLSTICRSKWLRRFSATFAVLAVTVSNDLLISLTAIAVMFAAIAIKVLITEVPIYIETH